MDLTSVRTATDIRLGIRSCPCLGIDWAAIQLYYFDTWHLVINTGTTIVTFLMVFLIQNTQNRDASAVQLKLDELIRASETARNKLLTLEDLTEAELDQLKKSFARIADRSGIGEGALREVETAPATA
jgi:low affinity Fe/Cu permease